MELTDYWWDAFRGSFETEDDVFDYIFDRVDTSDFEDSYIDAGGHGDCNELVKITASDKRNTMYDFMMAILDEVQKYRAIGTAEELQDMKSNYFEALSDWRQYRKIGTLEECRAAVEKQTAKKVKSISQVKDGDSYVGLIGRCPCCGDILEEDTVYCDCGQRLDWGDEE